MLLQRFRISTRILCASLIPMAAFALFAIFQIAELKAEADRYGATQALIGHERVLSGAIHTLQRERGYSFAHVGSQGRDMGNELATARAETDQALAGTADARAALRAFDAGSFGGLTEAMAVQLQKLSRMRSRIDALDLTASEAGGFYTAAIASILDTSREMAAHLGDPELAREFDAYLDAVTAKELAGQERGLAAGAIGASQFQDGGFQRFVELTGGQAVLMARFLSAIDGDAAEQARQAYGAGPSGELASMRRTLIMGGVSGLISGLDGRHWFNTASAWIEQLNKAALAAAQDIKAKAAIGEQRASVQLWYSASALAAATLGIALSSGTDVAREAAAITLMRPDLTLVPAALDIAARTKRTITQNLVWAFIYNVIGIPLAAFGILSPVFAGAAMAFSSVSVVTNSALLARWKPKRTQ